MRVTGNAVTVRVVAVQAYNTGRRSRYLGGGLNEVRAALRDLSFDSYKLVVATTMLAPYGAETRTPISPQYALHVNPLSKASDGRIKLNVRVVMAAISPRGNPVNALTVGFTAARGKQFKLRGLPFDEGELVVVVAVRD